MKVSEISAISFLIFVFLFVSTSIVTLMCLYFGYEIPYYKEISNILFGLLMFTFVSTALIYKHEVSEELKSKEDILDSEI